MPESLETLAGAFAEATRSQVNIRSRTAVARFNGRPVHLKTSDMDLGPEAAALAAGARIAGADAVAAVPLVGFDRARNVLVTEHVDGQSAFNALWNSTTVLGAAHPLAARHWAAAVERAAAWLGRFHRLPVDGPLPTPAACLEVVVDTARGKLRAIERSGSEVLTPGEIACIRRFIDRSRVDDWKTARITRIHGDFCPVNLLVGPDGTVSVLDFADARLGFALEDLVRLWCSIWEISESDAIRRRLVGPVQDRVLAAYGAEPGILATPPFVLLRGWNAITRILEAASVAASLPFGTRRLVRRFARLHKLWLLDTIRTR